MTKNPVQGNRIDAAVKLIAETRSPRYKWIRNSKPPVIAILEEFPYLNYTKMSYVRSYYLIYTIESNDFNLHAGSRGIEGTNRP